MKHPVFFTKLLHLMFMTMAYSNLICGEDDSPPPLLHGSASEDAKEKSVKELEFLTPLSLVCCGNITFEPGFRLQVRYDYDTDNCNQDLFIRRFRLKCGGNVFGIAKYYGEFKIDNVGRHKTDPRAEIENAWIDFILCENLAYLTVGMFNLPVSRDALVSDSKLLFMDRALIKEKLTSLGLADSTIGLLFHGRPYGGHLEYAFGIFDNLSFEEFGNKGTINSRQLMPAGRLVVNFLDPAEPPDGYGDYEESYIGKGHRLAIGMNGAYLGGAKAKELKFDLYVIGADIFYNIGPFTLQTEYDSYSENKKNGYGWYLQSGYLLCRCVEIAARYQELMPISDDKLQCASLGLNIYIRQHHLKIQSDYTIKKRKKEPSNTHVFEIQLQLDY